MGGMLPGCGCALKNKIEPYFSSLFHSGGGQELVWSMVLVASCLPMALSSVYKEMALGESELDPIYLNG